MKAKLNNKNIKRIKERFFKLNYSLEEAEWKIKSYKKIIDRYEQKLKRFEKIDLIFKIARDTTHNIVSYDKYLELKKKDKYYDFCYAIAYEVFIEAHLGKIQKREKIKKMMKKLIKEKINDLDFISKL